MRDLIKRQKEESKAKESEETMQIEVNDSEYFSLIRNLVDKTLWRINKFPLIDIGDIFNSIGERLENWKFLHKTGDLLVLLKCLNFIVAKINPDSNSKIDMSTKTSRIFTFLLTHRSVT